MAVATGTSSLSGNLLHHLLQPLQQPPPPPLSIFLRPVCISTTTTTTTTTILSKWHQKPLHSYKSNTLFTSFSSSFSSLPTHNLLFCHSLSTSSSLISPQTKAFDESLSLDQQQQQQHDETEQGIQHIDDDDDDDDDDESEKSELESEKSELEGKKSNLLGLKRNEELPTLTVKEKKELASYAHSLGKKLKSQLIGKSGVTENVATSFIETLEANELLKIKIHRTCPGELEDVVKQLEEATGSVVVGQIGRTVIIFRPSLTKLKAEEKKKQARKVFLRKGPKSKPAFPQKGQEPRLSGRGGRHRGSSRV